MEVLFLTSRFPFPLDKGDKLRAYYFIKELTTLGYNIHLFSLTESEISSQDYSELEPYLSSSKVCNFLLRSIRESLKAE